MQSGRENTLEERYAIEFFLNLEKMPVKMESVRDDERCGRSKAVNTPQLIGQRVRVRVTMLKFSGSS